jgi:NAD(P)-dependent dehydrogenase (short-subunit alcohol dehydrogenase family)
VTGGASGIGRACATILSKKGYTVCIADIQFDRAIEDENEMGYHKGKIFCLKCDVSKQEDVKTFVERVIKRYGRIDLLFNNAGILLREGYIDQIEQETISKTIEVNLKGAILFSKYVVPVMKAQGGGVIINNASISAIIGSEAYPVYSASKAAIIGLTKSLARQLGKYNIRVNCICPGSIKGTNLWRNMPEESKRSIEDEAGLLQRIPLRKIGKPEDIAHVVSFLASSEASHITGEVILVDGGEHLR